MILTAIAVVLGSSLQPGEVAYRAADAIVVAKCPQTVPEGVAWFEAAASDLTNVLAKVTGRAIPLYVEGTEPKNANSVIYFGDTARTPYGSKSPETIRAFAAEISDFLLSQDVKMLVIACNTVSAVCLEDLQARYPQIPVLGIKSTYFEDITIGDHLSN